MTTINDRYTQMDTYEETEECQYRKDDTYPQARLYGVFQYAPNPHPDVDDDDEFDDEDEHCFSDDEEDDLDDDNDLDDELDG